VKELWEKDRKIIFKELIQIYLKEGYNYKEAKRLASEETEEIKQNDYRFVNNIFEQEK
jgi:hypothetical protein|tara:strand:- start:803 stop:976 length:174 start_codon:yes stop_codon:yes gene_type:complete